MPMDAFVAVVRAAMEELPAWVGPLLDEIAVTVEDDPPAQVGGGVLLGRYHGIPRTKYGERPPGSLPDVITLYRSPILATCARPEDVAPKVLKVLGHEVGHALGLGDRRLRELGWH